LEIFSLARKCFAPSYIFALFGHHFSKIPKLKRYKSVFGIAVAVVVMVVV
jgi:hypothetical protein